MSAPNRAAWLRKRVDSFPYWHYRFDLGDGVVTPIFDPAHAVRHEERKRYFLKPAIDLLGGLEGRRVLDLGCNAGFWSLAAIEAGATYVLGIEGRAEQVEQARFVFEATGIDPVRYDFRRENVFDFALARGEAPFDLVLCLGLLYHVNRPVELFRLIERVNSDLLVVDTELSLARGSMFQVKHESTDAPRHSVDDELIFHPTRDAVVELARAFGYDVVALRPRFRSWVGSTDFRTGRRLAFVCAKTTSLASLEAAQQSALGGVLDAMTQRLPDPLRPGVTRLRVLGGRIRRRLRRLTD